MSKDIRFKRMALLALSSVAVAVLAVACGDGGTSEPVDPEPPAPPVVTDPMPEEPEEPAVDPAPEMPEPEEPVASGPVGLNARLDLRSIAEDGTAVLTLALAEALEEDVVVGVRGSVGVITFARGARTVTIPAGETVAYLEVEGVEIEDAAVEGADAEIRLTVESAAVMLNDSELSLRVINPNDVVFGTPVVTNDGVLTAVLSATLARASNEDVRVEVAVDEAVFGMSTVAILIPAGALTGQLTLTATGEADGDLVFTPQLGVASIAYALDGTSLTVSAPSAPAASSVSTPRRTQQTAPAPPAQTPSDDGEETDPGETVRATNAALVPSVDEDPVASCMPLDAGVTATHLVSYELSRDTVPAGLSTRVEFTVEGPALATDTVLTLRASDPEGALLLNRDENGEGEFLVDLPGGRQTAALTLLPLGSGTLNGSSKIALCLEEGPQTGAAGEGIVFAAAEGQGQLILNVLDPAVGTIGATVSHVDGVETETPTLVTVREGEDETATVTVRLSVGLDAELALRVTLDDPDDVIAVEGAEVSGRLKVLDLKLPAGQRELTFPVVIVDDDEPDNGGRVEVSLNAGGYNAADNAVLVVEPDPDDHGIYVSVEPSVVRAGEEFTVRAWVFHDQPDPVPSSGPTADYAISGDGAQYINEARVLSNVLITDSDPATELRVEFHSQIPDGLVLDVPTDGGTMFEGAREVVFALSGFSDLREVAPNGDPVDFGIERVFPETLTVTILPPVAGDVSTEMAMGSGVGMEENERGQSVPAVDGQILVYTDLNITQEQAAGLFDYAEMNDLTVLAYDSDIGVVQLEVGAGSPGTQELLTALRALDGVSGAGLNTIVEGAEIDVAADLENNNPLGATWAYQMRLHEVKSTLDAFEFDVPVTVAIVDNFVRDTATAGRPSHGEIAEQFINVASLGRAEIHRVQVEGADSDNATVSSIVRAIKETVDGFAPRLIGNDRANRTRLVLNVPYAPPSDCSLPLPERIEQMWDYREALTPVLDYAARDLWVSVFLPAGNDCVGHLDSNGANTQHSDNRYKTRAAKAGEFSAAWDGGAVFLVGALGGDGDTVNRLLNLNRVADFSRVHLRDNHFNTNWTGSSVDLYYPGRLVHTDFYDHDAQAYSGTSWASAIAAGQAAIFLGMGPATHPSNVLPQTFPQRWWVGPEESNVGGLLPNFADQFLFAYRESGGGGNGYLPVQFNGFTRSQDTYRVSGTVNLLRYQEEVRPLLVDRAQDRFNFNPQLIVPRGAELDDFTDTLERAYGVRVEDQRIADYWDVRQFAQEGGDVVELFTRLGIPVSDSNFRTEYPTVITYGGQNTGRYEEWYDFGETEEHRFGLVLYKGYRGEYLLDSYHIYHGPGISKTLYTLGVVRLPLDHEGHVLVTQRPIPIRTDVKLTTGDTFFREILVENSGDVGFFFEVESPVPVDEAITVSFDAASGYTGALNLPLADHTLPVEVTLETGTQYAQSEFVRVQHFTPSLTDSAFGNGEVFQYGVSTFAGRNGTTVTLFDEGSPGWARDLLFTPEVVSGNPSCCKFSDTHGQVAEEYRSLAIGVPLVDNDAPLTLNFTNREGIVLAQGSDITMGASQSLTLEVSRRAAQHSLVDWSDLNGDGSPKELTHLQVDFLSRGGGVVHSTGKIAREAASDTGPWSFDILRDVPAVADEGFEPSLTAGFFAHGATPVGQYTLRFSWFTSMSDSSSVDLPDHCCYFADADGVRFADEPQVLVRADEHSDHFARSLLAYVERHEAVEGEAVTVNISGREVNPFLGRLPANETELTGLRIIDQHGYLETVTVPAWDGNGRIEVEVPVKADQVGPGEAPLVSRLYLNFTETNLTDALSGIPVYGFTYVEVVDADSITVQAHLGRECVGRSGCERFIGYPYLPVHEGVLSEWEEFTALVSIDRPPKGGEEVLLEYTGGAKLTALDGGPPVVIFETATAGFEGFQYFGAAQLRLTHDATATVALHTDPSSNILSGELRIAPNQPGVQERPLGHFTVGRIGGLPYTTLRVRKEVEVLTFDFDTAETVTTMHGRHAVNSFRKGIRVTGTPTANNPGYDAEHPGYGTVCVEVRSDEANPRRLRTIGLVAQDGHMVVDDNDVRNRLNSTAEDASGFRFCALLKSGEDYYLDVAPLFEFEGGLDADGDPIVLTEEESIAERFYALGDYTVTVGAAPTGYMPPELTMREAPERGEDGVRMPLE